MDILTYRHPALRQHCIDVDDPSKHDELVAGMIDVMHRYSGAGIAAPQVGSKHRVVVIGLYDKPIVAFNPRIVKGSLTTSFEEEGCLSIMGFFGVVERRRRVTVEYIESDGTKRKRQFSGHEARVWQHEIDHLNGTLFVDRMNAQDKLRWDSWRDSNAVDKNYSSMV